MNYIRLLSTTPGLSPPIIAAFVELLRNAVVRRDEDTSLDLDEVILIRPIWQLGY